MPDPDRNPARERVRSALAASAAVLLACALGWSHGLLDAIALGLVTLATAATVVAIVLGRRRRSPPTAGDLSRWTTAILATGVALGLAYDAAVPPGAFVPPETLGEIRPLVALMAVAVASHSWRRAPDLLARLRFPAVLALAAAMGALVIRSTPQPGIDVWYFRQMGAAALLQGIDPYLGAYPNIYGPSGHFYAPAVLGADRAYVLGNPYPPVTLLADVPAAALGLDVRWVTLLLLLFAAWAVRRLGRGSAAAELAAVLVLAQPRTLFVLEQAWTEPAVLATVVGALLLVDGWVRAEGRGPGPARRWAAAGAVAGIALASKQYAPLLLLPALFAAPARARWRAAAVAVAVAAAVLVPFVSWDAQAFFRSIVLFQIEQPFRPDALSWPAAAVRSGLSSPPVWPAFLLAMATLAAGIRRDLSLDQAALTGAGAWLVLVLLNKQAFCNYYWLAVGLLCAAVALFAARAQAAEVAQSMRQRSKVSSGASSHPHGR